MSIQRFEFANSSMLANCEYDDAKQELIVMFLNGKQYTYVDVPKSIYEDLINAKSAGQYFNMIKRDLTIK